MLWKTAALLAAAFLATGAARAPKAAPAKPPAAKAAAKPAPEAFVDARDPASLIALLGAAGAKAEIAHRETDAVFVTVTSAAANFSVQFVGCDAQGRKCKAMLFENAAATASPPISQLNAYNQTSALCRSLQDKAGKSYILYSALVFEDDSRTRVINHLAAWQGCLAEFRDFLKDPNAYLASAP